MAVALVSTISQSGNASGFAAGQSTSGSNRYMRWSIAINQVGGASVVTSVSYNSVPASLVLALTNGGIRIEVWELVAPADGSHSWSVNVSLAANVVIGCRAFSGVHQTTPRESGASASGTSTAPAVTVPTSHVNQLAVDGVAVQNVLGGENLTVGPGQTQQFNLTQGGTLTGTLGAGSTEPGVEGSVIMSWTMDTAASWAIIAHSLRSATTVVDAAASFGLVVAAQGTTPRLRDADLVAAVDRMTTALRRIDSRQRSPLA